MGIVVIGIANGAPFIIDAPPETTIVICDYDVRDVDESVLETDEDGDQYQSITLVN